MSILSQGGVMVYPLLVCAAFVVGLAGLSFARLRDGARATDPRTRGAIDGVLFWGAFAVVLGLLGTFVGIAQAAQVIRGVSEVSSGLIWGGIEVALSTTILGLVILSVAAILWFVLRLQFRSLEAQASV